MYINVLSCTLQVSIYLIITLTVHGVCLTFLTIHLMQSSESKFEVDKWQCQSLSVTVSNIIIMKLL